jgi:cation:H+ antiporter
MGIKGAVTGFSIAAIMILIAAPFLAGAAENLAESTGLGGTFFGSIFVATCTSLPEVVTVFAAVRMKSFDLAVGNVFGSNCFNMLVFVPLDLVHDGPLFSAFAVTHVYTVLCGIVVAVVVILGQLHHVERKKPFLEPDAWMAILLILATFTGLYFVK